MRSHEVIVVGSGPTGLMLAGELALAGIDVGVVERRVDQGLVGSRAGGLHSRTIEIFDQRGIADRFLAEGKKVQVAGFAATRFDIGDFPTRHPSGVGLRQKHIECILAGCDGGRSRVRKAACIAFPGSDATMSALLAEAEMDEEPPLGIRRTPSGVHTLLHDGRALLLDFAGHGTLLPRPWSDRLRSVDAMCEGPWELPDVGAVAAPTAILARPDGYVAWVGEGTNRGLTDALTAWVGGGDRSPPP